MQAYLGHLRSLLANTGKKAARQHVQACVRALCQAQHQMFGLWQERKPQLAAAMGLQVRNHNAQYQQLDVIQAHHSALVRSLQAPGVVCWARAAWASCR